MRSGDLDFFLERLRGIAGDRFDEFLMALSKPRGIALRANTLRTTPEALRAGLESEGFRLEPLPWYPAGFLLRSGETRGLSFTAPAKRGELFVQNVSSMIPPLALAVRPGERVLDIAAAPGAKTTQIACLLGGTGELVANDRSRKRSYRLRAILVEQGVPNALVTCEPGEEYARKQPEHFDRVLVDAPCSAEGLFVIPRSSTWQDWSIGKVRRCARVQGRLVRAGLAALRRGGVLVYSTCTFAPEENEAVIEGVLEEFRGAVEAEEIPLDLAGALPGLEGWGGRRFDPALRKCLRVAPDEYREGFFIARLRKTANLGARTGS
ncbi:MAG: RsmB/NOP family class I SAM-dependent RNA methyltransferase [Planctomycetota bacterium]